MKKIIVVTMTIFVWMVAFAGQKSLPNGAVAFWQDQTSVIEYNSYRIEVQLSKKCDFNVWGTVTVGGQSKPLFIDAGKTMGYVDFENLDNGRRYSVSVVIKN
ncbi:MAG: hypothetical protein NC048_05260 [Bacteroides sp.]|nr:hypothetical protein [Ruminococcus flavefaciens]MCM1554885.1 hypothetical protein [Bacteroides sp.]